MGKYIQLFDLIKIMFNNQSKYDSIKDIDKSKNLFMVNRIFSIKFPHIAQQFNHIKTPAAKVVDCWQTVASKYRGTPGWIYTKTKKKKKNKSKKSKQYEPDDEILKIFLQKRELSMRQYNQALYFHPKKTKNIVKEFEERYKSV